MLVIGLTGSIATGKSTVSALLARPPHNLPIIDADLIARQVVEPGTRAYTEIVSYFGPIAGDELLLPSSFPSSSSSSSSSSPSSTSSSPSKRPLNRPVLSRLVFGSTAIHTRHRQKLNSIVHPAVRRAMVWQLARCYLTGCWAVVLDVPLLFESGWDVFCGAVLVVGVREEEVQVRRLVAREKKNKGGNGEGESGSGITDEEARARIHSQTPLEEKVGRALERERVGAVGVGWLAGWSLLGPSSSSSSSSSSSAPLPSTPSLPHQDSNRSSRSTPSSSSSSSTSNADVTTSKGYAYILWNDEDGQQGLQALEASVGAVVSACRAKSPAWWAVLLLLCPVLGALVAGRSCFVGWWARRGWEGGIGMKSEGEAGREGRVKDGSMDGEGRGKEGKSKEKEL